MKKAILAVLATVAAPLAAHAQYVKDFVEIDGARSNMLRGYGIVTGLAGNGDTLRGEPARMLRNMLQNLIRQEEAILEIRSRNVALVFVTAELRAFQKQGTRMDVTVSAVADARSLYGGQLQMTPLRGPKGQRDPIIYALASGRLVIRGDEQRGNMTTAIVPGGAIVEKAIVHRFIKIKPSGRPYFTLLLKKPDLTTCSQLTQQINQTALRGSDGLALKVASAIDGGSIDVILPNNKEYLERTGTTPEVPFAKEPVPWLDAVLNRPVAFATVETARVVIHDATKTVSWTGEVQLREGSVMVPGADQGARPSVYHCRDGQTLSAFMKLSNQTLVNQQVIDIIRALHHAGLIKAEVRSE